MKQCITPIIFILAINSAWPLDQVTADTFSGTTWEQVNIPEKQTLQFFDSENATITTSDGIFAYTFTYDISKVSLTMEGVPHAIVMTAIPLGQSFSNDAAVNSRYRILLYDEIDGAVWTCSQFIAPEGKTFMVGTQECIKITEKQKTVTRQLKMWDAPSQESRRVVTGVWRSIPRGMKATVIARTVDKESIGIWNNYWYCIEVPKVNIDTVLFYDGGDWYVGTNVWVFGQFLE
jgi:hypothetical protein